MSFLKDLGGFAKDVVKFSSEAPSKLREIADKESKALSDAGEGLSAEVEGNLRQSETERAFSNFGRWISKPVNLYSSIAGLIVIIWLVVSQKT